MAALAFDRGAPHEQRNHGDRVDGQLDEQLDWRLGHRPARDGLRGIAVLCVLSLHFWPTRMVGGGVGVDLFFVLSGFLITRLLIEELHATGRINIRAFYIRRVRRLAPALLVVVAVCATAPGAIWTLLYGANWVRASGGMRGPLEHTWSLSIEEQFYFVWPVLFIALARTRFARWYVGAAVTLIVVHRLDLHETTRSIARLTNGTDTRADALLIGCLVAMTIAWLVRIRWNRIASVVACGLVAHVGGLVVLDITGVGFTIIAIGCAVLLLAALQCDRGPLTWTMLTKVGQLSYSLYLWHYPITIWIRHGDVYNTSAASTTAAIVASLVAALASHRFIESPFRFAGRTLAHGTSAQERTTLQSAVKRTLVSEAQR